MNANPAAAGGIDELRQRLRYLVAVGLITSAFCASAVARVLPEERSVISYRVVTSLVSFSSFSVLVGVLAIICPRLGLVVTR